MVTSDTTPASGGAERIKLRGGSFTLLVLQLSDAERPEFFEWLDKKIAQAPYFFQHAPVVLDVNGLPEATKLDITALVASLREHQLVPVGIQNGSDEQNRAAIEAGLSVFSVWRSAAPAEATEEGGAEPEEPPQTERAEPTEPTEPAPEGPGSARLVVEPIRSGRQVYARGRDLIVLSPVSQGAEILADGHIHVYGALRGRAFAGVTGDRDARIFCRSLEAELVAIAGYWRVRDDIDDDLIGQRVQIYLDEDQVVIQRDD